MLDVTNIDVFYDKTQAVNHTSLHLKKGQIGCLLGPSGCGKTSILRAIAGFEPIKNGEITVTGNILSSEHFTLVPEKRNIAVVFQDFALFPHLSVAQNITFGLSHLSHQQQRDRVNELVELVSLQGTEDKFPHQLSGGQKQRVALARAMAPKPQLLLMDEPFANLDADLRDELAKDVRQILNHEQTTALMVTHDQQEAFAMADVIGVMHQGAIHQWGSAYDLYHRPATRFVADFIGEGVFIPAIIREDKYLTTTLAEFVLPAKYNFTVGTEVDVLVRPDDIIHDDMSPFSAKVVAKSFRGAHILYELQLPDPKIQKVLCLAPSHHDHTLGESIGIKLDLQHIVVFNR
ncbi:ABC transporter ATP-binding protein [Aliiglaciecola litoralis]|uniref:ABC transporter ATP-binding protein n=1 Tax=Aliiglaciecola litoralis TaxID=582857 RepID=A0ABN1LDC7_9ALTE